MQMAEAILKEAQAHRTLGAADLDRIRGAYAFAERAHHGQKRKSGEPYVTHVAAAALTVARWGLDVTTIVAALLHDVLEDTTVSSAELRDAFGEEVLFLVQAVTKVSRVKYRGNQAQVETLKKMILSLSEDIRVVFIKLADRLHNMETLQHVPAEKRQRIALETSEIYAPLAYRLGLTTVSGDLEDLAFPYLYPKEHRELSQRLKEHVESGQRYINQVRSQLEAALASQPIKVLTIDSRAKRLSSLHKKLRRTDLDHVYDLIALRVIVASVEDCYACLGLIHSLWPPLPGLIKDYIALPKPNGYRSLHTTVICLGDKPTEFQIRTEAMHHENEYGIAAYWAYQESKTSRRYAERNAIFADMKQAQWIQQLREWQKAIGDHDDGTVQGEAGEPEEFLANLKIEFFKDRIFVITPKGEVVDLPAGSTPVDYAYAIHSDIGHQCVGAKVNGKIEPLDSELQSGDVVEIITHKGKKGPSEAWLTFVKTSRARDRIRSRLRLSGTGILPPTTRLAITAKDRIGLIKDLSGVMAKCGVSINQISSQLSHNGEVTVVKVVVGVEGRERLERLLDRLRRVREVQHIQVG